MFPVARLSRYGEYFVAKVSRGMCYSIAMRGIIRRGERRHALRCVEQYVVGGGVMRCDAGDNTSWEAASCIVLWGRG